MHYRPDILGVGTFDPLPQYAGFASVMGQRSHLSALDIAGVVSIYGSTGLSSCTIQISPVSSTVVVNGTVQLSAVLMDSIGNTVSLGNIQWFSIDKTIATVQCSGCASPSATVTGVAVGVTKIRAFEPTLGVEGFADLEVIGT